MDFLENLIINLRATGPAAVLVAWVLAIAAVAIFAPEKNADRALTVLVLLGASSTTGLSNAGGL